MSKAEIFEKLEKIFKEVFDDENITISNETTAYDIEEWDSLEHINLIIAIEKSFHIQFSLIETTNLKSVGDIVDIIEKRKV